MAIIEVVPQSAQDEGHMPITILYLQELGMGGLNAIYMDDEGFLKVAQIEKVQLDFRYDHKTKRWVDVSLSTEEEG